MDGANVPPVLQVGTDLEKDDFCYCFSMCMATFCHRLVVWGKPVAYKSRNDKRIMNHGLGCLHRTVIFEVNDMKRISTLLQPDSEALALPNGILM